MVQQQQSKKTQAVHSGSHTLHYRVYICNSIFVCSLLAMGSSLCLKCIPIQGHNFSNTMATIIYTFVHIVVDHFARFNNFN